MKLYKITQDQLVNIQLMSIADVKTAKFYIGDLKTEEKFSNKEELINMVLVFKNVRAKEGKLTLVAIGKKPSVLHVIETEEDYKEVNNKEFNIHIVQNFNSLMRKEDQIKIPGLFDGLNLYGNKRPRTHNFVLFPNDSNAKSTNNKTQAKKIATKQPTAAKVSKPFAGILSIFSCGSDSFRADLPETLQSDAKSPDVKNAQNQMDEDFPVLDLNDGRNEDIEFSETWIDEGKLENNENNEDVGLLGPKPQTFL